MDPITASIVTGILNQAGGTILSITQQYVMRRLGLDTSSSGVANVKPLLDDYLQQLKGRLDEDRIAKLYGAFSKLKDAPRSSVVKQGLLIDALDKFHEVSQLPPQGTTGGQPNAQLRCIAFVGMAASYILLQDQPRLIVEKMVEAVQADLNTAKQWLGDTLVQEIALKLPPSNLDIICPKCSFRNRPGSRFCNQDGYLLISNQQPTPIQGGQSGKPSLRELLLEPDAAQVSYFAQLYKTESKKKLEQATLPSKWYNSIRQVENIFSYSYANVVLSILFAVQRVQLQVLGLYDISHGALIEGKAPDLLPIYILLDEESPSRIRVTIRFYMKNIWHLKSKELVDQILSLTQKYLSGGIKI